MRSMAPRRRCAGPTPSIGACDHASKTSRPSPPPFAHRFALLASPYDARPALTDRPFDGGLTAGDLRLASPSKIK
jgi:hypothetical protein